MFKVRCFVRDTGNWIDMPKDKDLRFSTACNFADIYKKNNLKGLFDVINQETGEVVYQL